MAIPSAPAVEWRSDQGRPRDFRQPKYVERFPTGVIAVGDVVAVDYSVTTVGRGLHVRTCPTNDQAYIGIAAQASAAASTTVPILIQVEGIFSTDQGITEALTAAVTTGIAQGVAVMGPTAVAGRAVALAAATPFTKLGVATTLAAANVGGIDICNPAQL